MSIILRDGTNSAQLATIDVNGNVHVLDSSSGTAGAAVPTTPTTVGGSDGTNLRTLITDTTGRQVIVQNAARLGVFPVTVQSTSASPATLIASAAAQFTDIVTLVLTNEGSATIVSISDGTKTYKFALAAAAANGSISINFASTLPATSSATAWTISNSAAQNVDCVAVYVKN